MALHANIFFAETLQSDSVLMREIYFCRTRKERINSSRQNILKQKLLSSFLTVIIFHV